MTVEVSVFGTTGQPAVTNYSDQFNRPDQPFYLGNDWYTIETATGSITGPDLALNINAGGGGATFGGGPATYTGRVINIPVPIDARIVRARSLTRGLFSEIKVTAVVHGTSCLIGPAVMINPNGPEDGNGYWLSVRSESNVVQLYSGLGPNGILSTPFNYSINDTVRLEVNVAFASNTIRSYQNGVLMDTFVDASPSRPSAAGLYGIIYWGSAGIGSVSFTNFSGGVL